MPETGRARNPDSTQPIAAPITSRTIGGSMASNAVSLIVLARGHLGLAPELRRQRVNCFRARGLDMLGGSGSEGVHDVGNVLELVNLQLAPVGTVSEFIGLHVINERGAAGLRGPEQHHVHHARAGRHGIGGRVKPDPPSYPPRGMSRETAAR